MWEKVYFGMQKWAIELQVTGIKNDFTKNGFSLPADNISQRFLLTVTPVKSNVHVSIIFVFILPLTLSAIPPSLTFSDFCLLLAFCYMRASFSSCFADQILQSFPYIFLLLTRIDLSDSFFMQNLSAISPMYKQLPNIFFFNNVFLKF